MMCGKTYKVLFYILVLILNQSLLAEDGKHKQCRALRSFEITVTAADEGDLPAINTISSYGLTGDLCDNRWKSTWGTAANLGGGGSENPHPGVEPGATWIKYEFDKAHELKEMWVWNYNEQTRRGLKNVVIEYTDDGKTWKKLGEYVLAKAPAEIAYAHNTTIDFCGLPVKAVIITAKKENGNYGDTHKMYGLSKIRFYAYCEANEPLLAKKDDLIAPAKLTTEPKRGVSVDRTYLTLPDKPNFQAGDVRLIKSMGFDFIKVIVNPAVHKSGGDSINMDYIDAIVDMVARENLLLVLCVHPEIDFKKSVFSNKQEFDNLCVWYKNFAGHLASRWTPHQLVLQMMTEPWGNSQNPDAWNCWNKLLPQMWKAIRTGMPEHTIILSGDQVGTIYGLMNLRPVNDRNVMYAFSYYEPTFFTWQGGDWGELKDMYTPYLKNVPYPSSAEIITANLSKIIGDVPKNLRKKAVADAKLYGFENWDRKKIAEDMQKLREWNNYYGGGLRLFCGEFGCYDKTVEPKDRYAYLKDIRDVFEENNISWAIWSYNEVLTILPRDRMPFGPPEYQKPDKQMLDALRF